MWKFIFFVLLLSSCSTPPVAIEADHHMHSSRNLASSDIETMCAGHYSDQISSDQIAVITRVMGTPYHRRSHALWHMMRSGVAPERLPDVAHAFGPAWTENHKLCPAPQESDLTKNANAAGEDFLYMHRGMLQGIQQELRAQDLECIAPWKNFDDIASAPLPPGSELVGPKSEDALKLFKAWDTSFHDKAWLASIGLSQLGYALEFTIHNNLHMRFATDRPDEKYRADSPDNDGATVPLDGNFSQPFLFDEPGYNWLADPYAAAVNPVFWKIHGYVDHFIDLWLEAHHLTSIATTCSGNCYAWNQPWTGESPAPAGPPRSPPPKKRDPPTQSEIEQNRIFNRARMAHQRIGVIPSTPMPRSAGPGGPPRGTQPLDPYQQAVRQLCQ